MPVYKSSSITDFFKPFSQPRQPKRPLPDDDIPQSQPSRRSRSSTPQNLPWLLPIRSCENTPTKPHAKIDDLSVHEAEPDASAQGSPGGSASSSGNLLEALDKNAVTDQLPLLCSQGPILASSQRVVKNGEVVVTNSDDEGSDSDASLGDIDELLRLRRPPVEQVSSPLTEPDSTILTPDWHSSPKHEAEATITRRRPRGSNAVKKPTMDEDLPMKYKFDLESLLTRSKEDEVLEEGMTKARNLLASFEQEEICEHGAEGKTANRNGPVDAELVASVMTKDNDENDAKRLMLAIERTEAFQQDLSWSFFENDYETPDDDPAPFRTSQADNGTTYSKVS